MAYKILSENFGYRSGFREKRIKVLAESYCVDETTCRIPFMIPVRLNHPVFPVSCPRMMVI